MKTRLSVAVVDDDPVMLEWLVASLGKEHVVAAFGSAAAALDGLAALTPDVIVSDVVMPGVGGFEFRRRYDARFKERRTPFIFLSSLSDPETASEGFEAGADDFITKPVQPEVLRTRLRAAVRRRDRAEGKFRGNLTQTSFLDLVAFCESKHFTGVISVRSADVHVTLPVRGGAVDPELGAQWIDRLCTLDSGTFELRTEAIAFDELGAGPASSPAGRVTSVVVKGRPLQIETQLLGDERPTIVSVVLAGGEVVAKSKRPADDVPRVALQAEIDAHHEETVAATRDRVSALRHRLQHGSEPSENEPEKPPEAPVSVAALFDEGLDCSRRGDWAGALAAWERALALEPSNKSLSINVAVARKKLSS